MSGILSDDPRRASAVDLAQPIQMLPGDSPFTAEGLRSAIQSREALGWPNIVGMVSKDRTAQPELARAVDLRVTGQDLLDQRRARSRQAEDEDGPRGFRTGVCEAIEQASIGGLDQVAHIVNMLVHLVRGPVFRLLQCDGVGTFQAVRREAVVSVSVLDVGVGE